MSLLQCLLAVHVVGGTLSVILGAVALTARKPVPPTSGRAHVQSGRLFLISQSAVLGSAAVLTAAHFRPYLLALTTAATLVLFSGVRVLRRRRPDVDPRQRATPLDWAVTWAALVIGSWLLHRSFTGDVGGPATVVRVTAYSVLAYASYDVYRFARPHGFPFSPQLWLYEHLVKMIGAYFGAVAAFSGAVLTQIPDPWRQLWPTVVGQTLMIVMLVRYVRRTRRTRSGDAAGVAAKAVA
jgi:hypothetical protein